VKSEVRSPKPGVCRALVTFALKEEAGAFRKRAESNTGISILITGIGRKNAEIAICDFLKNNSPQRVFTCGFAGGLNPSFSIGEVVFETGDDTLRRALLASEAHAARITCASRIATTAAEKQELRRITGADAVEMESEAIQLVCRERGIPCATVRVISDTAHEDLPLDFNQLSKPDLSLDYGKLAWAVAKSPKKIPTLLRLQKNSQRAAARLAEVLVQVIGAK
jgi:adenosylhomocysteine nucleosidase